jgi:hypothetical protein
MKAVLAFILSALLLCACNAGPGNGGPTTAQSRALVIPLATGIGTTEPSAAAGGFPSALAWAIVPVGAGGFPTGPSWRLFVLSGVPSLWSDVTPAGVDDSGGLAGSFGSTGGVVGVETSGLLGFSPLVTTSDGGVHWSSGILPSALALVPDAVAASSDGRLLALLGTDGSSIVSSADGGAPTSTLSGRPALAAAGGSACALTALTAVSFGPHGQPIAGGRCRSSSHVGIFELTDSSWKQVGPSVPTVPAAHGSQRHRAPGTTSTVSSSAITEVLRIWTAGSRREEVLAEAVADDGTASVFRLTQGVSGSWTSSAVYDVAPSQRLVATGDAADGSCYLLMSHDGVLTAEVLGPSGASWGTLPGLPAGTTTLVLDAGGATESLAVVVSTVMVYVLGASGSWSLEQKLAVSAPPA